jgi:hypothetical protein
LTRISGCEACKETALPIEPMTANSDSKANRLIA